MTTTAAVTAAAPVSVRPTVAVWFEIPADDHERAIAFYQTVLGTTLQRAQHGDCEMAIFPYERPRISGCIINRPGDAGAIGPIVFLNCDGQLDAALDRVYAAGGRIAVGATEIGAGMGRFAHIIDTEGNRIGLHAIS
jgi:predicted enzyme related to lactoylglutathione lyase